MYVSDFQSVQPTYLIPQGTALKWLEQSHGRFGGEPSQMAKLLRRYGCSTEKIERRYSFCEDFTHFELDRMKLFGEAPAGLAKRMEFFRQALQEPVARVYDKLDNGRFQTWIHVTCTGYVSPSVIQTEVSRRGWGDSVTCLHAYHMGCYAAFPALRMASSGGETEILHTELCTLHFNPALHDPEQLVIQSLFADGVIRYRVSPVQPGRGYRVVDLKEVIAKDSLEQMEWGLADFGFSMRLGREVPALVEEGIKIVKPWMTKNCVYAIHPGGPKIIDAVQRALDLSDEQVHFSRAVLREHGNMSSATLPHVWQRMIKEVPTSTQVISMAFGPGLTISTGLFEAV